MDNKELVILAGKGGGGGSSVTVDSALSSVSENPVQNKVINTALGNKADSPTVVSDAVSSSITLDLAAGNTIYEYGELTALTVTDFTDPGEFTIIFTSGSTPTVTDFPADLAFPEAFAAAANTRYEINVRNGYAVAVGWAVSA